MNSALPGEARAPGAAEAKRVDREVAYLGWRLDAPAGPRPTTPFALTIAAATGVALLPAAAARRHGP